MDQTLRRMKIVGNAGAGKTTFAQQVSHRLGIPHLELDAVFWGPDWRKVERAEGLAAVERFLGSPAARNGWVVDGNWNSRFADTLRGLEAIVWLDFPRRVVMRRVVVRTLVRVGLRRELWHGNRERWRMLLRREPDQNILRWAWTQHDAYRRQYRDMLVSGHVRVIRLSGPRQARRWLDDLPVGLSSARALGDRRPPGGRGGGR